MPSDVLSSSWKQFAPQQREALMRMAREIQQQLPSSEVTKSWGMPTFRVDGEIVLSVHGFTDHNSVFPGAGVIEALADRLSRYEVTKGTIHFDRDKPMPTRDVKAIIGARIAQLNQSYPRKSGEFKEFYANGRLKARGRMRNGDMTGAWQWFRKDGTTLRSGSFRTGERVGTWITYDQAGREYKSTDFGR